MNKLTKIGFLMILFSLVLCIATVDAQNYGRGKKKKKKKKPARTEKTDDYFDESGSFAHRLWYGGGLTLFFTGNSFNIGVTPMVGYKITDQISVGPRFKIDYYQEKLYGEFNYKSTSWGTGLFTRGKLFQNVFAHVEYEYENLEVPDYIGNGQLQLDPNDPNDILTERENRNNFHLGLGYTSGGLVAYEIMVLYNVLESDSSERLPWDLRFGFTYNF